jgi:hypothetical protein
LQACHEFDGFFIHGSEESGAQQAAKQVSPQDLDSFHQHVYLPSQCETIDAKAMILGKHGAQAFIHTYMDPRIHPACVRDPKLVFSYDHFLYNYQPLHVHLVRACVHAGLKDACGFAP